ncbi:MAG: methylase [Rhizobiales bacterium 24-66-13]|jgi:SAM-dependent methyltransferase|nr:MAG: methylase [Rhizobiales bacterium 35-66-30]OYZ78308.1 MAG: methylase [Rhizobiales bacterium 24-66-13]OZB02406.1 MAG: methylase [Rhizobiales bacterium 39-66-18]HQS08484.1 class I SAM-dependent methyltransferase [Xanthobacteraceae bacterium]HQS47386.1 class I SAM-dependent methyltransferase [Xanthobacteraceae bacterium]
MTSWASGYVSDIEYLPGMYVEQAPGHLILACLINGIEPPLLGDTFDYCELGCGQGVTANVVAASNPAARVVAVDFNPAHIARAGGVARAAGLDNVEFLELSFEEMLDPEKADLPAFDMVTLHGVWSWVSAEHRAAITTFLARRVKPGGIVSLSYNAMPGWTAILPLQRLMLEHAALSHERSDVQVLRALDFAETLQKAGSGVLGSPTLFEQLRAGSAKHAGDEKAVYLAHEYLNANWQPLYHMDTARLLGEAKLTYVGSATLTENFPDLVFNPAQRDILATVPAGPLRESVKDYLVNRPFRRDIFVRGARRMPDALRDARLRDFGLALSVPLSDTKTALDVPAGKAQLEARFYRPVFEALAARPHTLGELVDLPELRGQAGSPSLVELAGILIGTAQALPVPFGLSAGARTASLELNRAAVREVAEKRAKTAVVAAPLTGSGLTLTTMEALVYDGLARGVPAELPALLAHVEACMAADAVPLMRDGKRMENAEEARAAVTEGVQWCFENRLPMWRQMGAI